MRQLKTSILLCMLFFSSMAVFAQSVWTARTSGTTSTLNAATSNSSQIIVVGVNGTILTSPDGIIWASRNSGTTNALNSATWTGTQFVVVGARGTILTSVDGINWIARSSGITSVLNSIIWTGVQLTTVGSAGLTSTDGVTWKSSTGVGSTLNSTAWNGNKFIGVGGLGSGNGAVHYYTVYILASLDGTVNRPFRSRIGITSRTFLAHSLLHSSFISSYHSGWTRKCSPRKT